MNRIVTTVTPLLLLLAGCSFSASTESAPEISTTELEKQVGAKSTEEGLEPSSVRCPEPLAAKVDATASCLVLANDLQYDASTTVTSVDGSDARFDLEIPGPPTVPVETLEAQGRQVLAEQAPGGVADIECTEPLTGEVGQRVQCTVTPGQGEARVLAVEVNEASFAGVNFVFKAS